MTNLLALYRGSSLADARLIAVSSDSAVVADLAERLLQSPQENDDPAISAVEAGRRRALKLIRRGARGGRP